MENTPPDERVAEPIERTTTALVRGPESEKVGYGGDHLLSQITGLDVETIRRGRRELDEELAARPVEGVRQVGGGRLPVEKKTHRSRRHLRS